jgi:hypothetical protein
MEMLVMEPSIGRHLEEEDVERYSMGTMSEAESEPVEEHLLLCAACREMVEQQDLIAQGIRGAAPAVRAAYGGRRFWSLPPVWLAAAASVVLASILLVRMGGVVGEPQTVRLEAMRGIGTKAAANRPLVLQPDLQGLPAYPKYRLEVVNEIGGRVFEAEIQNQATVPGVPKGVYFVRVYAPSGEVLREYSVDTR